MARAEPTAPAAPADPPWERALLVCQKCDKHETKSLVKALRGAVRHRFGKKAVRVATVSCLDLCPKAGTVVVCAGGGTASTWIVDGAAAAETFVDLLSRPALALSPAGPGVDSAGQGVSPAGQGVSRGGTSPTGS